MDDGDGDDDDSANSRKLTERGVLFVCAESCWTISVTIWATKSP